MINYQTPYDAISFSIFSYLQIPFENLDFYNLGYSPKISPKFKLKNQLMFFSNNLRVNSNVWIQGNNSLQPLNP